MLSRYLYITFILGTIIFLSLAHFTENHFYNYIAAPLFIGLVVTYILSPQIDWWYYQRNPPTIDDSTKSFLNKRLPFYRALDEAGKQRFEQRMAMWFPAHEFVPMQIKSLPEEIQTGLAASAVQLTFGQADYLMDKFEKVIIYPSSFLSPAHPQHMHSSEIHEEDGAMIFSARHLMHGFVEPKSYYHTALHECIQVWIKMNPKRDYPILEEDIWDKLEEISHFKKAGVLEWIGLPEVDARAVTICHFLVFSERFQEVLPKLYKQIGELLNLNPLEVEQPILYINQS